MSTSSSATLFVSSAALSLSCISFSINVYLLLLIFCFKRIERKPELSLIYSRFAVDVLLSLATASNMIHIIKSLTSLEISEFENMNILKFLVAWPNFSLGTLRAGLVFFITTDRVLAMYFPIPYHLHRSSVSNWIVFLLLLCNFSFETLFLFVFCEYRLEVPVDCLGFGCVVNRCYKDHWLVSEQILYFSIMVMAVLLSGKLVSLSCTSKTTAKETLSRANRIALLDVFVVFLFDFLPAFFYSHFPQINFRTVGPIATLTKSAVIVMEAAIIHTILTQKQRKVNNITPAMSS